MFSIFFKAYLKSIGIMEWNHPLTYLNANAEAININVGLTKDGRFDCVAESILYILHSWFRFYYK